MSIIDPNQTVSYLNALDSSSESTTLPARTVANTDLDAASQALGKPLPAVIGTGRIDGSYFIGGLRQIDTVTTTDTYSYETFEEHAGGIFAHHVSRGGNVTGSGGSFITEEFPIYSKQTSTETTTQTVTFAGYVLAYDYFERGYDLIRVDVDGTTVFDSENNVGASTVFRFYGGRHTNQDEMLTEIIGDNAGAYRNFVMLFLDGYPAESPPSVSAVISNAATTSPDAVEDITGSYNNQFYAEFSAYDPGRRLIYQIVYAADSGAGVDRVHVLSIDSLSEVSRFDWPAGFVPQPSIFIVLPGTDYVLVSDQYSSAPHTVGVIDMMTGTVMATDAPSGSKIGESVYTCALNASLASPGTWLVLGSYLETHVSPTDAANSILAVFNTVESSLQLIDIPTAYDYWSYACPGRAMPVTTSFFIVEWEYGNFNLENNRIVELVWDGTTVTLRTVYTVPAGYARGVFYSASTGYVVVPVKNGTNYSIHIINPDSGALIREIPTDRLFEMQVNTGFFPSNRLFPAPGSVLLYDYADDDVWALNLNTFTLDRYANYPYYNPGYGLYDQGRNIWMVQVSGYWKVHRAASTVPGLIDLEDIVTDAMALAGFGAVDLTFSGFAGLSSYGFVIAADTTIQTVVRSIADVYGFSWCDTGSGFYFKKPGQGAALAVDAALTAADIVERGGGPVQSMDEASIRTPSAVEMEYQSKEGGYKARPASFSMTTGVLDSITMPKLSTPFLMADLEAQRIITEKFFEYQEKRRSHNLSVAPEHVVLLPGDIVSFPSGTISYTTRIESVGMDLRSMAVEISARDFQTEVETTITAATNNVPLPAMAYFASQYVHLDMPLLAYSDDTASTSLVQYGMVGPRSQELLWTGGRLYRGWSVSTLEAIFNQTPHLGVVGICTTVLPAPVDPFALTDTSTVTIRNIVREGVLSDKTEAEVLAGQNNALIGEPGRWEWVGYKTATDNGDGTYTLSGFVRRGYRGSEVFCATHAVGDMFVTLGQAWLRKTLHNNTDLNRTFYYRAVGIGQNPATVPIITHVVTGAAETPYAARNLAAVEGTPDGIDISWDYRSRIAEGLNPANHGEVALAFQIDIYDGTTWLRTLTSATNSVHYATADVIADFGVDPPPQLYFRVFMMSALPIRVAGQDRPIAGRGYEARGFATFGPVTSDMTTITADTILLTADET